MPQVNIVRAFTLTRDPKLLADDPTIPQTKYYPVGVHDMPDYDAEHWYVAHHTDNPPPTEPQPGTQAYAAKEARARARRTLVMAAIEQEAEDAKKAVLTEARSSTRLADAEAEAHEEAEQMERERQEQEAANTAVQEGRRPPPPPSDGKPAVPQRRRAPVPVPGGTPQGAASGEASGDQNPEQGAPPPNTP